ncbi:MAG: DNA-binding transcriptional regulator [Verrucomicrobiales bacterium]|nr:DNA-binding transcriptional regulator [Verrucomicrobiales bacterium]
MTPEPGKRIALLVETSLGSGREILRGIARYARQKGTWQLFHAAGGLADAVPDWIQHWDGDAIIARIQNPEILEALERLDIPVVDVLGVCENRFPLVHVDDVAISTKVANHFLDRNFRHFGFYGIEGENWSEKRARSFQQNCREADSFHELHTPRKGRPGNPDRFGQLCEWIRDLPKPNAIMVCSDQRGLELLEACRSGGIPVPEQIAVVGVDNDLALCEISAPPLSSVRGGHFAVGYEAARLVDRILSGEKPPREPILIPPNGIVERDSSQVQAIEDPIVARGVQFIRENLAAPITNDTVARATGISRTLFQKRFRECMQQSIREFILQRRIERARLLIESTDVTLAEVAERSGFRHQEYLGQIIKKETGKTPGALRKEAISKRTESEV